MKSKDSDRIAEAVEAVRAGASYNAAARQTGLSDFAIAAHCSKLGISSVFPRNRRGVGRAYTAAVLVEGGVDVETAAREAGISVGRVLIALKARKTG